MQNFHNYTNDLDKVDETEELNCMNWDFEQIEQVNDEEFNTREYLEGLCELAETQGLYQDLGRKIGKLVDKKQLAYGDATRICTEVLKVFLQKYKNEDNTYTIPESLLHHIFLNVRIIDKQCRIFSNPDGDLMEESGYRDISGYGLLGSHYEKRLNKTNG